VKFLAFLLVTFGICLAVGLMTAHASQFLDVLVSFLAMCLVIALTFLIIRSARATSK